MLTTVKGIYDHGKITLTEEPPLKETRADVIVTFLQEQKKESVSKRILGGLEGKISVPDNFNEPLDDLKDYM